MLQSCDRIKWQCFCNYTRIYIPSCTLESEANLNFVSCLVKEEIIEPEMEPDFIIEEGNNLYHILYHQFLKIIMITVKCTYLLILT